MQMLNHYFAPFALFLVLSAAYFGGSEEIALRWNVVALLLSLPRDVKFSLGILAASVLVNWWLSANTYRFIGWTRVMRTLQVWMNFIWTVPLFYLLGTFWAPMWLLFVMTPVTAALCMSWWATLGTALASAGTMMAINFMRGLTPESSPAAFWQAMVHATFIVVLALFVHALSETAERLVGAKRS